MSYVGTGHGVRGGRGKIGREIGKGGEGGDSAKSRWVEKVKGQGSEVVAPREAAGERDLADTDVAASRAADRSAAWPGIRYCDTVK